MFPHSAALDSPCEHMNGSLLQINFSSASEKPGLCTQPAAASGHGCGDSTGPLWSDLPFRPREEQGGNGIRSRSAWQPESRDGLLGSRSWQDALVEVLQRWFISTAKCNALSPQSLLP